MSCHIENKNVLPKKKENSIKKTVNYGIETLSYRSSALWSLVPSETKSVISLPLFKQKIKDWICKQCPYRLCRQFVPNLGFI